MTVDHLKMLHTAGGKGTVAVLTAGHGRSAAPSVQELLGKVDGKSVGFCQGFRAFFFLGRFTAQTFYSTSFGLF